MLINNFKKLTEVNLIFMLALYLVIPILGPYIKSLGYTNTHLGFIFTVFPLTIIFVLPLIGNISDKIGKKNIIVLAIFFQIVAFILYIYSTHLICILVARFLDAITFATISIITLAKVEDGIQDKNRGYLGGLFLSVGHTGRLIAPLIGGFLADYFFIRFPFFISIIIFSILLILLFDKKEFHFMKIHRQDLNLISDIKYFLSFKHLRLMGLLGMCAHATQPILILFLPLFIVSDLGYSYSFIGLAFFLFGMTHLLQYYFGKLCDRYGSYKIVGLGLAIYATGLISLFFINNIFILLLVLFVIGTGSAMWNVSAWTLMSDIGEKQRREGLILTTYLSIAKIGALFSFLVSGIIVDIFSFHILALIFGTILLTAAVFTYFMFSKYESIKIH